MRLLWSLGLIRGLVWGIVGTGAGMGFTMLVRMLMGKPAWDAEPVTFLGAIFGTLAFLAGVGGFRDWWRWALGEEAGDPPHHHEGPEWMRYFNFDPDHKIIGVQYTMTSLVLMLVAGILALIMRLELAQSGLQFITADQFNSAMTLHGIVMIGSILLGVAGMANYLLPLMLGAPDMAFPRLNALSYWVSVPAAILLFVSLAFGGLDTGWTGYPPLGAVGAMGKQFFYLGVFFLGFSSILGAINFITTTLKMRAPGMTLFRMPIFVWGVFAAAWIQLTGTQFIGTSFLMVALERVLGMGFFDPAKGGDPVLYQHIFWFYSHPAVYIFVLPGLGVISELLPVFVRKPLFGYKWVALSSMGIATVGFLVWAHHMFTVGLPNEANTFFMFTTMLVAVPTGVKFFSWVATMWGGKIEFRTPMLFLLGAFVTFLLGGLTGPFLAVVPVDQYLHDTYFVVGHFHNTMFGGFVFPFLAAIYYWFPKVTGRMYSERLGKVHFWLMLVGFVVQTSSMFQTGLFGMRRRIADYDPALGLDTIHLLGSIGGYLVFFSMLIFAYNMVRSLVAGEKAPANPWNSRSLEWLLPSPVKGVSWPTPPVVVGHPYDYGVPNATFVRLAPAGGSDATTSKEVAGHEQKEEER